MLSHKRTLNINIHAWRLNAGTFASPQIFFMVYDNDNDDDNDDEKSEPKKLTEKNH